MRSVFLACDTDGDGVLTLSEVEAAIDDPEIKSMMEQVEIRSFPFPT